MFNKEVNVRVWIPFHHIFSISEGLHVTIKMGKNPQNKINLIFACSIFFSPKVSLTRMSKLHVIIVPSINILQKIIAVPNTSVTEKHCCSKFNIL